MKVFIKSVFITLLMLSTAVFASELSDAKKAGLIGEQFTGYLGLVDQNASADIKALVLDINGKRKARYQQIAKKRKATLKSVELVAGQTAIEKTEKGNYIKRKGEGWNKK